MDKRQAAKDKLIGRMSELPPDLRAVAAMLLVKSTPDDDRPVETLSLEKFVEYAWPVYSPGSPYQTTFHIGAICEHLEALERGQIRKLLVMCPPRHSKSSLVSVMYPAWRWTTMPTKRFIFTSYSDKLSTRDSVACREIIRSNWYQQKWGHIVKLSESQATKTRFQNTEVGWRIATTINSSGTGEGCDVLVMDDPHNIQKIESDALREQALFNWNQVMVSRVDRPEDPGSGFIITMQRSHVDDLAGSVLKDGGYEILCLPAEYEKTTYVSSIGWSDPRTEHGQPLWPDRFGTDALAELKRRLGDMQYAGQYQQRPVPLAGGLFKKHHFRFCYPADGPEPEPVKVKGPDGNWVECYQQPIPDQFDTLLNSWDCSFKDGLENDPVSGQVWGFDGPNRYCIGYSGGRMDYRETKDAIRALKADFPRTDVILIEDKANGPAVISELRDEIAGIVPFPPEGMPMESKMSRAKRTQPSVESGNCYILHPDYGDWVWPFIEQHCNFGKAKHDDDVDAHCQAFLYSRGFAEVDLWGGCDARGILNG